MEVNLIWFVFELGGWVIKVLGLMGCGKKNL